jgi:hypothetical protein
MFAVFPGHCARTSALALRPLGLAEEEGSFRSVVLGLFGVETSPGDSIVSLLWMKSLGSALGNILEFCPLEEFRVQAASSRSGRR